MSVKILFILLAWLIFLVFLPYELVSQERQELLMEIGSVIACLGGVICSYIYYNGSTPTEDSLIVHVLTYTFTIYREYDCIAVYYFVVLGLYVLCYLYYASQDQEDQDVK